MNRGNRGVDRGSCSKDRPVFQAVGTGPSLPATDGCDRHKSADRTGMSGVTRWNGARGIANAEVPSHSALSQAGRLKASRIRCADRLVVGSRSCEQARSRLPTTSPASAGLLGGEGGIRTPVALASKAVFKTAAFNHSATSPERRETSDRIRRPTCEVGAGLACIPAKCSSSGSSCASPSSEPAPAKAYR